MPQLGFPNSARARIRAEVTDGVNRANQRDKGSEADHQGAEGVRPQEAMHGRNRAPRDNIAGDLERHWNEQREGEQVQPFPRFARARGQAEQTGADRDEQEKHQRHGDFLSIRAGAMEGSLWAFIAGLQ